MIEVGPGDVVAIFGGHNLFSKGIRLFEELDGKPPVSTHVIVVTHQDAGGNWMGIEGKPSGVGVCDIGKYLQDPRSRANHDQPRDNDRSQVSTFLASCAKSLRIPYDWVAIVEDVAVSLHMKDVSDDIGRMFDWSDSSGLPNHVVCSSMAAALYEHVGWAHPDLGSERICTPADWWLWASSKAWLNVG